jgi:hypothetical protein
MVAHATLVFWGFWRFDLGLDPNLELEFEFEEIDFIDIAAEQADEPEPEPGVSPIPLGPELPEEGLGPEEAEDEEEEPKKQFGDKTAKVDKLAPSNATFFMLMANRRIKRMPYADDYMLAFSPQRDFKYLVDGGGFHPWNDFEYMLIASSDIRDPFQNFIVVAHKLDNRIVKAGIERAARNFNQTLEWEERDGVLLTNPRPADPEVEDKDPRFFVLLSENTAVYVREEFLDVILDPDAVTGDKKTSRSFVANLTKLRRFAAAEPKAGFTMVARDLTSALKKGKDVAPWGGRLFSDMEFQFEAARSPNVLARLEFPDENSAVKFASYWSKVLSKKIQDDLKLKFTVGALYKAIKLQREGAQVTLRAKLTKGQAESAAKMAAQMATSLTEQKKKETAVASTMREQSMLERAEDQRRLEAGESLDAPAGEAPRPAGASATPPTQPAGAASDPPSGSAKQPPSELPADAAGADPKPPSDAAPTP